MISVSACWFNFRSRKCRCEACRVFKVQKGSLQVESSRKIGVLVYKISWETFSATSRREISRRDVIFEALCHVATWIYTSRRQNFISLLRRDVDFSCRDVILTLLCHVATCIFTSQRQIVKPSVTSRREAPRRDVAWLHSLSRRDVAPHVTTWPCF